MEPRVDTAGVPSAHSSTSTARDFHYRERRQWAAVISSFSPCQWEWIITGVNTFSSGIGPTALNRCLDLLKVHQFITADARRLWCLLPKIEYWIDFCWICLLDCVEDIINVAIEKWHSLLLTVLSHAFFFFLQILIC